MHFMLVHINNCDDSKTSTRKRREGRDSVVDLRSNTIRNPSKHSSCSLLPALKDRRKTGL